MEDNTFFELQRLAGECAVKIGTHTCILRAPSQNECEQLLEQLRAILDANWDRKYSLTEEFFSAMFNAVVRSKAEGGTLDVTWSDFVGRPRTPNFSLLRICGLGFLADQLRKKCNKDPDLYNQETIVRLLLCIVNDVVLPTPERKGRKRVTIN